MAWQGVVTVSDGEILLNEFPFETVGYQPPQYPRSVSYEDTAVASGSIVVNRRSVTDLGALRGVWKPFTIHCYNSDNFDTVPQPGRGEIMWTNLLHLFTDFIGVPLILTDRIANKRYYVMFTQDGLVPTYSMRQHWARDDFGQVEDYGPEYDVQVSFIEVESS